MAEEGHSGSYHTLAVASPSLLYLLEVLYLLLGNIHILLTSHMAKKKVLM